MDEDLQDLTAFIDSAGLCLFTSFALGAPEYRAMLNEITGYNFTDAELLQSGERIYNLERLFNAKAGIKPNRIPCPKTLNDGIPSGPSKGKWPGWTSPCLSTMHSGAGRMVWSARIRSRNWA